MDEHDPGDRVVAHNGVVDPDGQKPRRSRAKVAGLVILALVLVLGGLGTVAFVRLNGNIRSIDTTKELGTDRPPSFPGVLNILVIGTDSREGLGNRYGDAGSVGHADTNLLVHVAANRGSASVISIPRDLMVQIPDCLTDHGTRISGEARDLFNVSLGQSGRGPGCVMKTAEKLTGIRIDHFVMVDFQAVKDIANALGGVEVCTTRRIDDEKSGLHLEPGTHRVRDEQALAFLRTRHGVGFGSDLDRIKLQQQFLASMIRGMRSAGTIANPAKLFRVLDATTKALTVDEPLGSILALTGLATDLDDVPSKRIVFTTVPVLDSTLPGESGRLVLLEPRASDLFAWVGADHPLTQGGGKPSGGGATPATDTPGGTPTTAPSGVDVVRASTKTCA